MSPRAKDTPTSRAASPSEPAPADSESTPERLLDVAERLFAEKGYAGTAVRDIARAAGLTAPSLYNHFDGKQALYEAVLARGVQPLVELNRQLDTGRPVIALVHKA